MLISNTKPRVIICSQVVLSTLKEACQNIGLSPNFVLIDSGNNDEDITDINEIWEMGYPGESAFKPYDVSTKYSFLNVWKERNKKHFLDWLII